MSSCAFERKIARFAFDNPRIGARGTLLDRMLGDVLEQAFIEHWAGFGRGDLEQRDRLLKDDYGRRETQRVRIDILQESRIVHHPEGTQL